MATLLTKKSDTASSVPLAADLTNAAGGAELAVNTADKRLYSKTSGGTVVELGTNPSSMTLPNGTANGVPYLNGSKVLTSGSALTFDGATSLAVRQNIGGIGNYSEVVLDITNSFSGSGKSYLRNISLNGGNSSTALAFGVNADGGGAPSEQMRLTSTGLGIGTSSPATKLHVVATPDATYNSQVLIGNSEATTQKIAFNPTISSAIAGLASGAIAFYGNGANTERMRLDSSGNLGLGVTPSAWGGSYKVLEGVGGSIISSGASYFAMGQNYYNNGTSNLYKNTGSASLFDQTGGSFRWFTAPSGTAGNAISFTQAMTLDASGVLNVGATSFGFAKRAGFRGDSTTVPTVEIQNESATGTMLTFRTNGESQVGSVSFTSTGVLYNITSDARAKHDIIDAPEASGLIDAIKVRSFKWNANDSEQRYGFIAQELVTVAPEAVHQPEDPEQMMAVDYSKLVPMLVKEIQSLRARVAQLEGK